MPRCLSNLCGPSLTAWLAASIAAATPCGRDAACEAPPASACRVRATSPAGVAYGSGVLVADRPPRAYVLTCEHLSNGSDASFEVAFPGGQSFAARLAASDRRHDLALLVIASPGRPVATVGTAPKSGALRVGGFGSEGRFRTAAGPIVGYALPGGADWPSVRIAAAVRPGDSGGPVMDRSGRVVGVAWGVRDGQTYATVGRPLTRLLERVSVPGRGPPGDRRPSSPPETPAGGATADRLDDRLSTIQQSILNLSTCSCSGCVTPSDLAQLATHADLLALTERLPDQGKAGQPSGEAESTPSARPTRLADLAAAVGIGGSSGLAGVAAGLLIRRRNRGRGVGRGGRSAGLEPPARVARDAPAGPASSGSPTPTPNPTRPIAVDTPPPPQRTATQTHYVPYETGAYADAHQWASEQVARKYPGSIEVLTTLDSLIKQQLGAKRP